MCLFICNHWNLSCTINHVLNNLDLITHSVCCMQTNKKGKSMKATNSHILTKGWTLEELGSHNFTWCWWLAGVYRYRYRVGQWRRKWGFHSPFQSFPRGHANLHWVSCWLTNVPLLLLWLRVMLPKHYLKQDHWMKKELLDFYTLVFLMKDTVKPI